MTTTNFPNGLTSFGVLTMGVSGQPPTSGTYWYVSSVIGSAGFPGTLTQPFATITQAQTAASAGDVVVLMSGHAETVASAAAINLSKAGVTYVGIGNGAERPTFTFNGATTATLTITAADISLTNVVAITALDSVVSPFVVSAANVTLGVTHQDTSAIVEAVRVVLTTAAANNFTLNLVHQGFTAGDAGVNGVRLVGGRNATVNVNYYGKASTAIVEFVTTATVDTQVSGLFYNSGTTDLTKNVVDTATGSTWSVSNAFDAAAGSGFSGGSGSAIAGDDVSTVIANQAVPTADSTANAQSRDVVGNKTDAAVTTVGTTKSILAYIKGAIQWLTVAGADSAANASSADVIGNKTDASVYVPGATTSQTAYLKGHSDLQERVALKAAATITNGQTLFTVAGGPVEVMGLVSICVTGNDGTASTLQYSATPTSGSAQTISGASASLASALAGASVTLAGTALATAALLNANGPNLIANPGTVMVPAGTITAVVGVGSTTGTWRHYIRYKPLAAGVTVS